MNRRIKIPIIPIISFALLLLVAMTGAHVAPVLTARAAKPADSAAPPYLWPLGHPPSLTSSFGEYRTGHFHAGIDLSTSGAEGIPVYAVDDGEVVRVRASGVGYGRAVYLRLRDGRLAVHAHLASMMEPLARYVEDVQDSLGLYRVDLYPEPGRFRVRRGQEIARSGSSGAGGPHFHFELREGDIAVNPLNHGLVTHDVIPPALRGLVFTPFGAGSSVNGEHRKVRVPFTRTGGGSLALSKEVQIWGRVGVGLDGYDRGRDGGDAIGIHRVELHVDGERRFIAQFDRFDYNHNHEVEAEFDYEMARAGRRSVRNLFVPSGIAGDFHDGLAAGAGILEAGDEGGPERLAPGVHELRIVAADASRNAITATVSVRVAGPPILDRLEIVGAGGDQRLEVQARGRGRDLARLEVGRGMRTGEVTPWRSFAVDGSRPGFAFERELFDNPHDVMQVQVVDVAGQRSNRHFVLARAAAQGSLNPGSAPLRKTAPAPAVELDPDTHTASLVLEFASPAVGAPRALLAEKAVLFDALDTQRFRAVIDALGQNPLEVTGESADGSAIDARIELPWTAVPRDGAGTHTGLDGRVRIDFPAGAFFGDAYLWVADDETRTHAANPALVPVSSWFRVEPSGRPLDRAVWVGCRFDSTAGSAPHGTKTGRVGLYRTDEGRTLSYEGAEILGGSAAAAGRAPFIGAQVRHLGSFVLARDIEPPTVRITTPAAGKVLGSARPRLRAVVRDRGSGFREDDVTFLIDGRRVPTEWDAEANVMLYRPRVALPRGRHVITAQATDRSGLTTRREITVTVP